MRRPFSSSFAPQPNLLHLLQTAEGIRKAGHPDWLQLVGLLHDMGKIMFLWGDGADGQDGRSAHGKQWALGGDTFVVGCRIPDGDAVVFPEFNGLNPDMADPKLNTPCGIYAPGCGLDALKFAWGHDEYMYRMLVANGCALPREGLDMVRYHSAYPWHDKVSEVAWSAGSFVRRGLPTTLAWTETPFLFSCRRKGAYAHLMKPGDHERRKWVQLFNKFDLYTKVRVRPRPFLPRLPI